LTAGRAAPTFSGKGIHEGGIVKAARPVIAIVAAGAALYAAGWIDGQVMPEIVSQATTSFDVNGLALATSVGTLAVAGVVLALGALAWNSRSLGVGVIYSAVGAVVAFLPVIEWRFAAQINDNPPLLPRPIADEVSQIYTWSNGPLNAMETIGAGMLVVGVFVIARSLRGRSASPTTEPRTEQGTLPTQP
jgi:hypothetical protein